MILAQMEMKMTLRAWATPLTMALFLMIGATGVAMFFHMETPLNKALHEWFGWGLLAAVVAHLWLNRRAFSTYFKRPVALGIVAAGSALLLASFVVPVAAGGEVPVRQVLASLGTAPISTLAELTGGDQATILAGLAATHPGAQPDQSLADLTGGDREAAIGLLAVVYTPDSNP